MDMISIREHNKSDLPLVYQSWLRSYKNLSQIGIRSQNKDFYEFNTKVIDKILANPDTKICIAALADSPEVIIGYLVYEPKVLHFCFVKREFRKFGIAKSLVLASDINLNEACFSHWTFPLDQIIPKYPKLIYNPYIIYKE